MKSSFKDCILYLLGLPLCDIEVFVDLKQSDKHAKRKRNQEEGKPLLHSNVCIYADFFFFDTSLSQPTVAYGSNLNSLL